jgi:antitoxin (DNA-binding transcriptional repressor) of toxin-antitoxin stability system
MIKINAEDASQNFLSVLATVVNGETIFITRNDKIIAELHPHSDERRANPEWRAAYDRMIALMKAWPDTGYRVGALTEDDKYGDTQP